MEAYLNKGIKDIISQFPEVGNILNEYNIGCAPCNVGTCLLKDIVEVHNLSYEQEHELMTRIAGVIYSGKTVEIPRIERKVGPASGEIKYSPPMKKLVDEHVLIKRLLALIPVIVKDLNVAQEQDKQMILDSVDFIRSYADRYHHAKEEDILFKKFGDDLEIIKAMLEEHQIGRGHAKAVLEAVEACNNLPVKEHIIAYRDLLAEHIRKEDEILYPWMDRNLSMAQVGDLFAKFNEVDKQFKDTSREYERLINALEEKFQKEEVS